MIIGKIRGWEFNTENGLVRFRATYTSELDPQEKAVGPWEETAPELGFHVPIESNDRREIQRLQDALRSLIGCEVFVEAGEFHIAERRNPRPSAI